MHTKTSTGVSKTVDEVPDSMGIQLGRTDDVSVHRTGHWREPST